MHAAAFPFALNCGCQKRALFGSLPMMKSFTRGNVRATRAAQAAKSPGALDASVIALARSG